MVYLTDKSKEYIKHLESRTAPEDVYKLIQDLKQKINAQRLDRIALKGFKTSPKTQK